MGKAVTVLLGIICVVLLIICVILGILLGLSIWNKEPKVCSTPQCLADASRIKSYLNTSVDPCDNFYDFACGSYPKDKAGSFRQLAIDVNENVRQLLAQPIKNWAENSTERKMKEYYASCMQSDVSEDTKMAALMEMVKNIGGFDPKTPVDKITPEDFNAANFNLDTALQYIHGDLSSPLIVRLRVKLQPVWKSDTLESFVSLSSARAGKCVETMQKDNSGMKKISDNKRYKYVEKVAQLFAKCLGDSGDGKNFAKDVMDVETFNCENRPRNEGGNRTTWDELLEEHPWLKNSEIDWPGLFEKMFREWNHQPLEIFESGLQVIKWLEEAYKKLSMRALRNSLIFNVIRDNVGYTPKCFRDAEIKATVDVWEYGGYGRGNPMEGIRKWQNCVQREVNPTFSLGVLAMSDKQKDPPIVTDEKLHAMAENIRRAALKRTLALPWLDDYLKERIKKRVENKEVMIGGPRRVIEDEFVDKFYEHLDINISKPFLVNRINARKFRSLVQGVALRSPNIHYLLYIGNINAIMVNARNMVYQGGIIMYWPILQQPFYNYHSQEYLQYGGIGAVIGHEFGHDFDGVHTYDTWANQTEVPDLVKSETCLQDYYYNIDYPGWELPSRNSSRFNPVFLSNQGIPDVVGLYWSLEAYRKHVADRGREDAMLAGLPYTQEQLFLIARAQLWCNNDDFKFATIRVLGSEGLNPYFPEIFNCPKDAPMNPENKCNLW